MIRLRKTMGRTGMADQRPVRLLVAWLCFTLALLCGSTFLLGCDLAPQSIDAPTASPLPPLSAAEVNDAVRFRKSFGLRSDEAWIQSVAADPASEDGHRTFGISLLPSEVANLLARTANSDDIAPIVAQYGAAASDDWAGLFIDQQAGGTVVARFRANIDRHKRALAAMLPNQARFEVRDATWSGTELQAFVELVSAEKDWFPTVGATFSTAEIAVLDNVVDVRFNGNSGLGEVIEGHFGNPPWLRAVWNGPREWAGARGDLLIIVTDARGNPGAGLSVDFRSDDPRVSDSGDIGYRTDDEGRCLLRNLPAVLYDVHFTGHVGEDSTLVAEGRVRIRPDDQAVLRLVTAAGR